MYKLIILFGFGAVIAVAVGLWLTAPNPLPQAQLDSLPQGDVSRGEIVFWAGGCASCHAAPDAKGDAKLLLTGGLELKTPFGVFRSPNISPDDENGLGRWTVQQFANAMKRGVNPDGQHYYPAFPFTSYARMTDGDVADLWAFLRQLPKSSNAVAGHDLPFPFSIRRGLGLWKQLYLKDGPVVAVDQGDPQLVRGQYLVEALGHCGECHTPRNLIGGADLSRWMGGGIGADGKEKIPNITPHSSGIGSWSAADIAESLKSGFTPEFDSFGSEMVSVQENMAKLSDQDRAAIGAYLAQIPAISSK